ncbi:hypothetical protein C4K39_1165 [Pseudomonas sessilinigenes]|nr:hypothetical protein C4K39_1165 [Pseudomonas sessilinigenes]
MPPNLENFPLECFSMSASVKTAGELAEYMTGAKTLNSILFSGVFADFRRIRHTTLPERLLGFLFTHAETV